MVRRIHEVAGTARPLYLSDWRSASPVMYYRKEAGGSRTHRKIAAFQGFVESNNVLIDVDIDNFISSRGEVDWFRPRLQSACQHLFIMPRDLILTADRGL